MTDEEKYTVVKYIASETVWKDFKVNQAREYIKVSANPYVSEYGINTHFFLFFIFHRLRKCVWKVVKMQTKFVTAGTASGTCIRQYIVAKSIWGVVMVTKRLMMMMTKLKVHPTRRANGWKTTRISG